MDQRLRLTYFYDYNCPYCYLSHVMIDQLSKEFPLQTEFVSWKMPDNAEVAPKPPGYREEGMRAATAMAATLGVPIRFDSPGAGTRAAHEATKIAISMGRGLSYIRKVFRRKWEQGEDLSDRKLLIEIAGQAGLDKEEFGAALSARKGRQAVDEDFARGAREKIWTIPSFKAHGTEIQIHHFKDMPTLEQLRKFVKLGESFLDEK